jgi:LysM repeat protein
VLKRLLTALLVPVLVLVGAGHPAQAARPGAVWHVVAPGETMRSIAAANGLRVADVGRWNQIVAPYPVHVDETLRLTPPRTPLHAWRTSVEVVTAGMVGWDARRRCPVVPANLRRVWVSYIDLQGNYHDGSIIVRRDVVVQVQRIFFTLFRWRYRIMAMAPMSVNMPGQTDMGIVTAGYNCRPVDGTKVWSQHAYGTAIDINPLQNPMVRGSRVVSPAGGAFYLRRNRYLIGMIHPEGAGRAFTANGYFWGGQWRSLKDYMHFSITNQ